MQRKKNIFLIRSFSNGELATYEEINYKKAVN